MNDKFKEFTITKVIGSRVSIDCVKGLWGVDAPTLEQAEDEARHYFRQYWSDGEYSN